MTQCWLNGVFMDTGAARIDPTDRGFTLGDGVFETLKINDRRPLHLARHMARLRHGAALLGIAVPADDATIEATLTHLSAPVKTEVARITLSRGPARRGLLPGPHATPTLLIALSPLPAMPDRVDAILCRTTRRNEHSPLARIKSLNYLDSVLARQEADRAGATEAILLNTFGTVAEATSANVFVLQSGTLLTPPIADGALPGIARGLLIEREAAVERTLTPNDLFSAEAVVLTNSLGLRSLSRLEGQNFPPMPAILAGLLACCES